MSSSGKISKHHNKARQHSQALAASADYELSRAMQQSPGQRKERLVNIVNKYQFHIPTWIALADEHLGARRLEEARYALRRASRLDPDLDRKLPPRLRALRSLHGLSAPVAPVHAAPAAKAPAAKAPAAMTRPAAPSRAQPRITADDRFDVQQELASALRSEPGIRKERLVRLTSRCPDHAPAWLALAEEHMTHRRVEDALYSYSQALARDPALADHASQSLARAWRFHRAPSNTPHTAPDEQPASAPGEPDRGDDAGDAGPADGDGSDADGSRPDRDDTVDARLATALARESRYQRVIDLRRLFSRHRSHPGVLFHLAIESALAGNEADARYAAELLKQQDPEQHERLLQVADRIWGTKDGETPVEGEIDSQKLTGMFLAPGAEDAHTVIVDSSALRPRWASPASLVTVVATSPQQPVAMLCEQCWSVFRHDSPGCPDPSCRAARPATGWRSLPYRFRQKFLFVELLGRGDTGAVFRARDADNQAGEYAIKVLRADLGSRDGRARLALEQEVSAACLLGQHHSFVSISAHDSRGAQPFLVMELVTWPTLRVMLHRGGPLTAWQAARLGASIAEGLECMHAHQMVHRALEPENIFVHYLDERFTTKIAALGRWIYDSRTQRRDNVIEEIPGCMDYLSPEQTRAGPLTTASDIHAVGSILWEAAIGWVPFPVSGRGPDERLNFRYQCSRVPPERPAGMEPALHAILARALAHDPAARWSAGQMRYELDALAFHLQSRARGAAGSGQGRALGQSQPSAAPRQPAKLIDERRELVRSNKFLLACLLVALMLFTLAIIISLT